MCQLEEVEGGHAAEQDEDNAPHLDTLCRQVDDSAGQKQRQFLRQLLDKFSHIFSASEMDMGRTELVRHEIDTGDNKPVRQTLRPQPLAMLGAIDEHLRKMLQQGLIVPLHSDWSSNVFMVKKRDRLLRFCIDYRKLNEKTVKDVYPLPRIDGCLDTLAGSHWFSTFDLRAGYHQVALHPRDVHKTTFITRRGSYQLTVLPFGLCNAPATFERLMDLVLSGLNYEVLLVYLDDIIIFSKDLNVHFLRLELLFLRLEAAGLKLKPSKCHILQTRVLFLGHVVSAEGISTAPDKINLVKSWPRPTNVREVRSFVGLCSYYRRYVHDFARIAEPLHALTRKNLKFAWDGLCEESFLTLKEALAVAPTLSLPTNQDVFILDTDASEIGLGAVLSKVEENEEKPISFESRLCSPAERNDSVTRRELLAVMFALKTFRQYLLGRHFTIRTDHAALRWLRKTPTPIGQQARWIEQLEEFDFTIQHRPGSKHGNADALSRRPGNIDSSVMIPTIKQSESEDQAEPRCVHAIQSEKNHGMTFAFEGNLAM